jgi:hypothetical protein
MQNLTFAEGSVKIVWREPRGRMVSMQSPGQVMRNDCWLGTGPSWEGVRPLPHFISLHTSWCAPQSLDFETVKHLELLANSRTGAPAGSLFGVLNQTSTSVGAALLRAQVRPLLWSVAAAEALGAR